MSILAAIDPIVFSLGPITVRWYGLTFVAAVLAAVVTAAAASKRRGLDPEFIYDIAMVVVPSGIIGARLYEVFALQWEYYRENPGDILAIWKGGLAIHGGVLLAIACGYIYTVYRKQPFWLYADMIAPGLILAQGIGRWGNFFNQEAYGADAPAWLAAKMPAWLREGMLIEGAVKHPAFLYESVWNVLCAGVLFLLQRRNPPPGTLISLYFVLYNVGRFAIESIREDSSFILGGIRVAQLMALVQIIVGLALLVWHTQRGRQKAAE